MSTNTAKNNCPHRYPNTTFFVPLHSVLSPHSDRNNDCSATKFSHNQPSSVSNLTSTTQVGNDVNNVTTHIIFNPPKKNHSTPEIPDKPTTTDYVQPNAHSCIR